MSRFPQMPTIRDILSAQLSNIVSNEMRFLTTKREMTMWTPSPWACISAGRTSHRAPNIPRTKVNVYYHLIILHNAS